MLRIDLFRQSFDGLSNHRLRSFLTIFGIMWGIVAFIFSRAVLDGFQHEQGQRFAAVGQDMLVVNGGRTSLAGLDLIAGRAVELTLDDVEALSQGSSYIKHISPELVRRGLNVESKQERISAQVHGVWPVYQKLRGFETGDGRLLNVADEEQSRRVCILGADVAEQLSLGHENVPGELKIAGLPYTVVGIARKKPEGASLNGSDDKKIIVPFSSAARDFPRSTSTKGATDGIVIQPLETQFHERLVADVKAVLARRHSFSIEDPDALGIFDTIKMARDIDNVFSGLKLFGDLTAVITVLIGSIGVMNTMLISVRQRTREIGLRRCIGARNLHIFSQFLSEGLFLTSAGGGLGILIGCGLAFVLRLIPIPNFVAPIVRPWPVVLACAIITIVGTAAALYPTWQAVKVNPVEALHYE